MASFFFSTLFTSSVYSGSYMTTKLFLFWYFLWSLLIPVLISVLFLMFFLSFSRGSFMLSGMDYPLFEVFLVIFPIILLGGMLWDSLSLLYSFSYSVGASLTLKVVGSQWYWNFEVSDLDSVFFSSYMKSGEDLLLGDTRFLEVDNRLVLPFLLDVQVNVTSSDVIHSFAIPSLGVKGDATAGILNVLSFNMDKAGLYWGQCSEICGMSHSYMPISLESSSFISFYYWVLSHF